MNVLKNGTTFSSTSSGDGIIQNPSVYIVGCGYSVDLQPVQMYISEVLVYDMLVMNGDKIASIIAYLRSKWNI